MATDVKDIGENIGHAVGKMAREAAHSMSGNGNGHSPLSKNGSGSLGGMKGVAAGAALAAAPFAARGAGKLVMRKVSNALPSSGDGSGLKEKVSNALPSPKPGKTLKNAGKKVGEGAKSGAIPGGGGGDKEQAKKGTPGVGKGRRMPIQQAIDVAVPIDTAYNQWTQFEEWPSFMHRLEQATQEDDNVVSFKAKIWGVSREFEAQIVEQRPDERIRWTIKQGLTHDGVVTFHKIADRLTRVQVTLDVQPGSLLEKAARGMRHIKRAVRADLHRFAAFIEMQEAETGAWRGVIHDGEVTQKHDRKYDKQREYADFDDIHDTESSATKKPKRTGSSGSSSGSSSRKRSSRGSSSRRSSGRSRGSSSQKRRSSSSSQKRKTTSSRSRKATSSRSGGSSRKRKSTSGSRSS